MTGGERSRALDYSLPRKGILPKTAARIIFTMYFAFCTPLQEISD